MDAFGVEFSSLGHLHHLPVTTLKIDRSFVQDIMVPPHGRTIVEAVVNLAHGLGKLVVAEGIETIGQAELMQDLGCDLAQGSFFSWPVPATSIDHVGLQ
jgi:EAL domain-containing protein (putative c-di-GMP-specific phosphodiesterase class I)